MVFSVECLNSSQRKSSSILVSEACIVLVTICNIFCHFFARCVCLFFLFITQNGLSLSFFLLSLGKAYLLVAALVLSCNSSGDHSQVTTFPFLFTHIFFGHLCQRLMLNNNMIIHSYLFLVFSLLFLLLGR